MVAVLVTNLRHPCQTEAHLSEEGGYLETGLCRGLNTLHVLNIHFTLVLIKLKGIKISLSDGIGVAEEY